MHPKIPGTVILLLLQICLVSTLIAQNSYPSRDSKEWNNLTVAQRWQAVNIPEETLSNMLTNELLERCVHFDFMWDIFSYPNYGIGLEVVIEHYNGLAELLSRKDAGELVLNFYKKINLNSITTIKEPVSRGEFAGQVFFLELFLSTPQILKQFRGQEERLIQAVLHTYDTCLEINARTDKTYYSGYSMGTKVLVMGRVIDQFYSRKTVDPALKGMDLSQLTDEKYQNIIQAARQF